MRNRTMLIVWEKRIIVYVFTKYTINATLILAQKAPHTSQVATHRLIAEILAVTKTIAQQLLKETSRGRRRSVLHSNLQSSTMQSATNSLADVAVVQEHVTQSCNISFYMPSVALPVEHQWYNAHSHERIANYHKS